MRPHRRTLGGVLVLVALVAGATGLYPVLIKAAFDAFTAKDRQAILLAPLFVIVVTSVKGFSLLALTVLTNRVVTRIEADMQSALFGHLIDADLAQVSRESPAALTQRFTTDFLFIKEALTRLSTVFLREVATIIALDRRHAVDRSPRHPRGGGDGAVHRLADRPDRQEAAARRGLDAGADGPDGRPHQREPRRGPRRQDLQPRGLSQGQGARGPSTPSGS